MKRNLSVIIAILVFFAQSIFAEPAYFEKTDSASNDIEISVRYYDKTVYYPEGSLENPILVHVTVANKGSETYRFKLSDDRMFSLDFNVYNLKNLPLEQQPSLKSKRTTSRTVYFREISLESGEEYSFVENLKDYISITDSGMYYLEAKFYPELYKLKDNYITSNRLNLDIRPELGIASTSVSAATITADILKPEEISPDKVVEQTIIARQRSLWDHYFLYIDVEQMLINDDVRNRRYRSASEEDRKRMLANYKSDLMLSRIDNEITAIPESFVIEKTEYSQTEGIVSVIEWFKESTFSRVKKYVYYVRQRDGIWQIYKYEVTNLRTE